MSHRSTTLGAPEARHLLRRSGFGAPREEVDRLVGKSRGEAVDAIVDQPTRPFLPRGKTTRERRWSWIRYMLKIPSPLQEKLVLFWHDHFATADSKVESGFLMALQNALLRRHSKGNFRALLKAINKDAAMMEYLDTVRNDKAHSNENYARELMELFTLGVDDATGNPNYTQADVVQLARAFSGWDYDARGQAIFDKRGDRHDYSDEFPERGPKVVFTTVGGFGETGRNYAESGEGAGEIDRVIDILLDHRDSTGHSTAARFLTTKLIAYFARPERKRTYTSASLEFADSIIAESGFDTNWDLTELLRALFTHDLFYAGAVPAPFPDDAEKSVRWPADLLISTLRLTRMRPSIHAARIAGGDFESIDNRMRDMGQQLFDPPSVFGWDWQTAWLSSTAMMARYRFARDVTAAHGESGIYFRPQRWLDLTKIQPDQIVEEALEVLGISDQASEADREIYVAYLTDGGSRSTIDLNDADLRNEKIHGLFALLMQSPAYQLD